MGADLGYLAPKMSFCPYFLQLSPSSSAAASCTDAARSCLLTHGVPFLRYNTERSNCQVMLCLLLACLLQVVL